MKVFYTKVVMMFMGMALCIPVVGAKTIKENGMPICVDNQPLMLQLSGDSTYLTLAYGGKVVLKAHFPEQAIVCDEVKKANTLEQVIHIRFDRETSFVCEVLGSDQALAAETRGKAQEHFPMIRTTHGLSNNLRNNAIYERLQDWMLEAPEGTRIVSHKNIDGSYRFDLSMTGQEVDIVFRPLYYQKHKNLTYYQPWTYDVYKESVTGWCSWWAYMRECTEQSVDSLLAVWDKQKLSDYGYRFIQLDDVFQGEKDKGRTFCKKGVDYRGGRPTTWLDWKKDLFPGGMNYFTNLVRRSGFKPAIWIGCFFSDEQFVAEHPTWFVTDKEGKPYAAPWISYTMDASNPEVAENLIRPTFRALKNAGMDYVKIDQLRHFLYDGLHNQPEWVKKKGLKPSDVQRAYLQIAREELGDETFILACWGVDLPAIGIADACRIGSDGYGPVTMQQYNSWNGLVWRNDPDHCDIKPNKEGVGLGNVTERVARESVNAETIIRPALASVAGASLMLSDRPDVYEDPHNLYGLKRVSPVVFSVPGQLYDFDPSKTDWIKTHTLEEITSGSSPAPLDGNQHGVVCPYWLNEFDTNFDHWSVLHRLNWTGREKNQLASEHIQFADLGLDVEKEYLVYEFWSDKYLGTCKGGFDVPTLMANGIESWAIREKKERPQLLSTNRHLSQGCVDIEQLHWEDNTLRGRSRVIQSEEYVLIFHVPSGFHFCSASIDGKVCKEVKKEHDLIRILIRPEATTSVEWEIRFDG